MKHYGGKQLAESFRNVRKNTVTVAQDIPEDKYNFRAAPETRTVAEMLTHIAWSPNFHKEINGKQPRFNMEGFDFPAFIERAKAAEKTPRTKAQIIDMLTKEGEEVAAWMEGMSDEFLAEVVTMPPGGAPPARSRFDMILSVKEHEMHHRGQLMLIERLVGITPHLTRRMQERMNATAAAKK